MIPSGERSTMSVIHQESWFTSLPGEYYTSPEIFQQEIDRVFARQWIYVGQVGMVRNPGDYFVAPVATESLIITRDQDGRIRAFFNVCRHRGSQICKNGDEGNTKRFSCPYHSWTWRTDGTLTGVPGSPDGSLFDYKDFPLHEARVEVLHGTIWVWLGEDEPPSLADSIDTPVDGEKLALIDPTRQKLAHEERYRVSANWKLVLENNCECYHCAATHPSLSIACDFPQWFLEGDAQRTVENPGYFPLRPEMKTFSMTGDWVSKRRLGDGQAEPGFSIGLMNVPIFSAALWFGDYGANILVNPVDVNTTELVCQWFVHEDAVEGVDYEVDPLIRVFDNTNREDLALAEGNARGTRSRRFTPGPNNKTREAFLEHALDKYLDLMARP